MSLYDDIVRSQVKQGNLGGKHGPLGSYAAKKQKAPKVLYLPLSLPPSLSFSLIPHPLHTHSTLIHSSLNSLTKQPAAKPKEKVNFTVSILDGKVYKSTDANGLSDPWVRICKSMWRGREGKGGEGRGREGRRGGEEEREMGEEWMSVEWVWSG